MFTEKRKNLIKILYTRYGLFLGSSINKWYNRQSTLIKGIYKNYLIYNFKYVLESFYVLNRLLVRIIKTSLKILFITPYYKSLVTKSFLKKIKKSKHDLIFNTINGGFLTNNLRFFINNVRLQFIVRHSKTHAHFICFLDSNFFEHVVRECMFLQLPIISFTNTSNKISGIDYFIYSNNKSYIMLKFFIFIINSFINYESFIVPINLTYKYHSKYKQYAYLVKTNKIKNGFFRKKIFISS